jgi:hypothetical protein
MYSGHEEPGRVSVSVTGSMTWNSEASGTPGSGRRTRAWSHENTTVLAPMPTARDSTMTELRMGARTSERNACRASRTGCSIMAVKYAQLT